MVAARQRHDERVHDAAGNACKTLFRLLTQAHLFERLEPLLRNSLEQRRGRHLERRAARETAAERYG